MNTDIIVLLCLFGYMIIAAIITGVIDRFDDNRGLSAFLGVLWPVVALACVFGGILYLPYRIGRGKHKEDK